MAWVSILKSVDHGRNWTVLFNGGFPASTLQITKLQIIACGTDSTNLKLFLGICTYLANQNEYSAMIDRFDANTGAFEDSFLNDFSRKIYDLAIASDYMYPATGSNPYSLAAVYFKRYQHDSIYFCSSSNGGISFDTRLNIAGTTKHLGKVALAYGRCSGFPGGRYFVSWEEKETESSLTGHIYTSHSEPNFNSSFTVPVLLDILDSSTNNKVRSPSIACQFNSRDNDSSDLTSVIVFEKSISMNNRFEIAGCYNKKGVNGNTFNSFSVTTNQHINHQPDVSFNPYDSTFMLTFFDSTLIALPYMVNDYNFKTPDAWDIISPDYNNGATITSPNPQVHLDQSQQAGINGWIAELSSGNGVAMFASPVLFPVGNSENDIKRNDLYINVFPNPLTSEATLEFELGETSDVVINLFDDFGRLINAQLLKACVKGSNRVTLDCSSFNSGIYLIRLKAGNKVASKKILIR